MSDDGPLLDEGSVVSFGAASRRIGIAEPTLRRKVREMGLTVYTSPRDRRLKYLRASDVEQFLTLVASGAEDKENSDVA